MFFVMPFERDYTLIGTTDLDYSGDLDAVRVSTEEIEYLCDAASSYFRTPVTADQVLWSYSGVRPLYDDGASEAQEATRDYVLKLDASRGVAGASQHFRRQDHHLSTSGGGGAGDPVAPPAPGAESRRMDRSGRVARRRFSDRRVRNPGERNGGALSFSRARHGSPSCPRIRHSGGKAAGRGEDAIGSRPDFRRRPDRSRGPLSRQKRMGDERRRHRLAALQAGIANVGGRGPRISTRYLGALQAPPQTVDQKGASVG